jgi:REP element-mobilizing transposase RayT
MTRPLRIQHKGGWYHVVNRGIDRADIYRDDRDKEHFLELLESVAAHLFLEIHGYVLMDNHYHLILRVPEGNLSQGMQWLNVSYSIWFNRRHNRVGPLFQGRYQSVPVDSGGWVYQLSQYVHLNPVRVRWLGLDKNGRRLEGMGLKGVADAKEAAERLVVLREYRWSSYRSYAGYGGAPKWLSRQTILQRAGGKSEKEQMRRYRGDLERYVSQGYAEGWAQRLRSNLAIGAEDFIRGIKRGLPAIGREAPCKRELKRLHTFAEVVGAVESVKGEEWKAFSKRHGDRGREMVLLLARECTGMTLKEIGQAAGGMDYAAVSEAIKRIKIQKAENHHLATTLRKVAQILNI